MKLLFILLLLSSSAIASDLDIISWYKLNSETSSDSAAEVCFTLKPAPTKPIFAYVIVDKNRRSEAVYSTWIGPKGSTCHVVSTSRGLVEVEVPELKLKASLKK